MCADVLCRSTDVHVPPGCWAALISAVRVLGGTDQCRRDIARHRNVRAGCWTARIVVVPVLDVGCRLGAGRCVCGAGRLQASTSTPPSWHMSCRMLCRSSTSTPSTPTLPSPSMICSAPGFFFPSASSPFPASLFPLSSHCFFAGHVARVLALLLPVLLPFVRMRDTFFFVCPPPFFCRMLTFLDTCEQAKSNGTGANIP